MMTEVIWFLIGGFFGVWFGYFIAALMNITNELEKMNNEMGDILDPLSNREKREKEDEQSRRDICSRE